MKDRLLYFINIDVKIKINCFEFKIYGFECVG